MTERNEGMQLIFLSHPQVVVEPAVPVTQWHLAPQGRAALQKFLSRNLLPVPDIIFCSEETKAQQTAALAGKYFKRGVHTHCGLGENDRSATGFLPPAEFEQVADQFFAKPHQSVRGWETAAAAQKRICNALADIMALAVDAQYQVVMIAGHGATGTLLYCALAGLPVSRDYDQPEQGHYWCYDYKTRKMLHHWYAIC
ncbi:histidine phosphatase family protein [Pseudochrobactrum sp. HB0163]|uniref:histidine phosphatase family protein n=1 Tax=Pseudochrobactrum sp. HB0163 TaxID=3450708 RepID=UPI003F6E2CA5